MLPTLPRCHLTHSHPKAGIPQRQEQTLEPSLAVLFGMLVPCFSAEAKGSPASLTSLPASVSWCWWLEPPVPQQPWDPRSRTSLSLSPHSSVLLTQSAVIAVMGTA